MDLRLNMPGLSGNVEKDLKNLNSYVFQLTEELRYLLHNLDVTNFNDLGLMRYENGRLQIYSDKLQAAVNSLDLKIGSEKDGLSAQIKAEADALKLSFQNAEQNLQALYTASADGLRGQITQELGIAKEGIDEKVAQWELTVNGFSTTFTEKLGEVNQTMSSWSQDAESFKAYVQTAEGKISSWEVTESKITTLITAIGSDGSKLKSVIKQEIRDDESLIQLIADEVEIEGVLTIEDVEDALVDGKTVISGDNILTGTIRAADFIASGDMYMDEDEFHAFVVQNEVSDNIGWIGYQFVREDKEEDQGGIFGDKLWIRTESYDGTFCPSIKLSAAGRISMEAKGHAYSAAFVKAPYYITLDADSGDSNGMGVIIRDNENYEWNFRNGHLYLDGEKVL